MSDFKQRLQHTKLAAPAFNALLKASEAVHTSGVDPKLLELIFLRVSQINGCAFCADMHSHDLLKSGEDQQRLNTLAAWREIAFFTEQERAALNWAERFTDLKNQDGEQEDAAFALMQQHFSESEIANITFAVAIINAWNRLGVSMRPQVMRRS
ncbi:carboxymuconolactone decarboxylase family protein [Herbaspirillum sp. LeCh32-8]|uniref:carboxymuconolactone decarboxylase family protein n=1 Tax=Herbaspirillum sp. LeCh32-8 TaxID=2821356 RepID=UPI001AE1A832|nr:carboxymuconolactone decarboxylase family protein [Herbaspirillum sp. LeCh32-8]MBP0599128.1 carboxymuconolactone decarboxylase family protein [Herbaspirillum sp. LeCh32-8]